MRSASTVVLESAYRYACRYVPEINLVRSTGVQYRRSTTYFQVLNLVPVDLPVSCRLTKFSTGRWDSDIYILSRYLPVLTGDGTRVGQIEKSIGQIGKGLLTGRYSGHEIGPKSQLG